MSEAPETIPLFRVHLLMDETGVSLREDEFEGELHDLVYRILRPEKMSGYRLKYVMRSKLGQVIIRPQEHSKPLQFDHFIVYSEQSQRTEAIRKLSESIEGKLAAYRDQIGETLKQLGDFKREHKLG